MTTEWLNVWRGNITSQNGEDGVLDQILHIIGTRHKWCVDVGAGDGKTNSNTWNWIANNGWNGVLIEADSEQFDKLRVAHKRMIAMCRRVSTDLDKILAMTPVPWNFDLLSIDVDGEDQQIWGALNNYHPRVVVIEVDSRIPPDTIAKSSIFSCVKLGKEKGYELALHTGNCIFVRRQYAQTLGIDCDSWSELFDRSWLEN
jgi:hypothetical protein